VDSLLLIIERYYSEEDRMISPLYTMNGIYNKLRAGRHIPRDLSFGKFLTCVTDECLVLNSTGTVFMQNLWGNINVNVIKQIKGNHKSYAEAYVFGMFFQSRGFKYRESTPPMKESRYGQQRANASPVNKFNKLEEQWHEKHTYSNWCAYVHENKTRYGLVNYFFRLNVEADPLIHKFPMASICSFNCTISRLAHINVKNYPFNEDAKLFIPVTSIYSTRILSVGLDNKKQPIPVRTSHSSTANTTASKYYSTIKPAEIETLILLKLHPERKRLVFDYDSLIIGKYTDSTVDLEIPYSK
jgi:hypothetical protein